MEYIKIPINDTDEDSLDDLKYLLHENDWLYCIREDIDIKAKLDKYLDQLENNSLDNMIDNPENIFDEHLNEQETAIQDTILLIRNFLKWKIV